MKRILFIWQSLEKNGGEVCLINLLQQIEESFLIEVFVNNKVNQFETLPQKVKFIFNQNINKINFLKKVYSFFNILKIAKKNDILIINDIPYLLLFGYLAAKIYSKKCVLWCHANRGDPYFRGVGFKGVLTRLLYKFCIPRFDSLVNVSLANKKSFEDYLITKLTNSRVIYNYIPAMPTKVKFKIYNNLRSQVNLLMVSRLTREKRLDLAIKAIVGLTEKGYRVRLTIVGVGVEQERLVKLAESLGVIQYIDFVGFINDPFIKFMDRCDIFISCSDSESFSLSTVEALSINLPVVVTNTAAAELINFGQYGIVVSINNVAELILGIEQLITDSELYNSLSLNSQKAIEQFDNKNITNSWIKLLGELK